MFLFVLGLIILLIGLVVTGIAAAAKARGDEWLISSPVILLITIALSGLMCLLPCVKTIPTGHTGIVTTFGKVENYTYEAGVHFDKPWAKIIKMDNRTQRAQIQLSSFSSDIQEVTVTYTVNYQINKANAQTIYKTIGTNYFEVVVQPKVLEAVKGVFAKYTAENLVAKRANLSQEIEEVLTSEMEKYNIEIINTSIEDIDFTDTFTNAVEAKQVAEQNKLKAKTEQEQAIIEANAQAEKVKIDAQAKADAQIIAAEADAEVARIGADAAEYQGIKDAAIMSNLGEMLDKYPELVEYYYVTGWDGKLPETMLGSDTSALLNLDK